jgi:preprotein translocase subunit Sec63
MIPYSYCQKQERKYMIDSKKSSYCTKYVQVNVSYNALTDN